ncbi:RICIN domain-containing protein [Solirubrobacter taibaiensis]|nr:RICIN domain-containing protein [Solirubrobacter taibaiensis]
MNSFHTKRIRRFLALALAGSAAFVASTSAAQAQVPVLQPNKPYKIKFGHSGQILNVPNASNKEGEGLVTYFDIPGFKNDDFTFIKVGGSFPANTYVIEAGKNAFGLPLYVVPKKGEMGAQVIQDRTLGAFSAWQLRPGQLPGFVEIVHLQSGLAMNVAGASPNAGTPVIVWQPSKVHLNDDVRILSAS